MIKEYSWTSRERNTKIKSNQTTKIDKKFLGSFVPRFLSLLFLFFFFHLYCFLHFSFFSIFVFFSFFLNNSVFYITIYPPVIFHYFFFFPFIVFSLLVESIQKCNKCNKQFKMADTVGMLIEAPLESCSYGGG